MTGPKKLVILDDQIKKLQTMLLTKEQISEQMRKHAEKKNGLHDLMEIMLESMMVAERGEFLADNPRNKGNRLSSRFHIRTRTQTGVSYSPRPLRQLPSADTRHTARPGRRVQSISRCTLYKRAYAGTGRRCVRPDLWTALLQIQH